MKKVPSIGRIVQYKLDFGPNRGQYRPAIITRVWNDPPTPTGAVQLVVFVDGSNDGPQFSQVPLYWATSRVQGDDEGQWIWPPYVPANAANADSGLTSRLQAP